MYSETLEKLKLSNDESVKFINGMSVKDIMKILDEFSTKDSLLYVPQKTIFKLFDEYCEKNGIPQLSHKAVGRAIRQKYNFKSKPIRYKGEVIKIYVEEHNGT